MKKLIFTIITLTFLLSGCVDRPGVTPPVLKKADDINSEHSQLHYRLTAVSRQAVVNLIDLEKKLTIVVEKLLKNDSILFMLRGFSPSMSEVPVWENDTIKIHRFFVTSKIEWNFGRRQADPTNEVILFNSNKDAKSVYLRMSFMMKQDTFVGPGIVTELRLGNDVPGRWTARGVLLDKVFSILIEALDPDFAYIELPGHPNSLERPDTVQAGWITYLAPRKKNIQKFAIKFKGGKIFNRGVKIYASDSLVNQTYDELIVQFTDLRSKLVAITE